MSTEKQHLKIELDAKRKRLKLEGLFRQIFELNAQVERNYAEIDKILGLNPDDKVLTTEHEISEIKNRNNVGRLTSTSSQPHNLPQSTHVQQHFYPSSFNPCNNDALGAILIEKNQMTSEDEITRSVALKKQADRKFHENALTNDLNTLDQLISQRANRLGYHTESAHTESAPASSNKSKSQQIPPHERDQHCGLNVINSRILVVQQQNANESESESESESKDGNVMVGYRRTKIEEDDEGNEIIVGLDS